MKKCIFCRENSSSSISVEHIIPESLGNTELILKQGLVCDKCNNYFSLKVEAPFLNHQSIIRIRSKSLIPSKKGKIPLDYGVIKGIGAVEVKRHIDKNNILSIGIGLTPEQKNL